MVPSHVDPVVVKLSRDGALTGRRPVLVTPFPVQTPDNPGPDNHVLQNLGSQLPPLPSQIGLSFFQSLPEVVADVEDLAVDLHPCEKQVKPGLTNYQPRGLAN